MQIQIIKRLTVKIQDIDDVWLAHADALGTTRVTLKVLVLLISYNSAEPQEEISFLFELLHCEIYFDNYWTIKLKVCQDSKLR